MSILSRNNVIVSGDGTSPIVFAHGYGCDQNMWRFITPAFEKDHKVVTFDYVGAGKSDLTAYDNVRYSTLDGYAADVVEIIEELDLHDVIFVGHSVSSMIGLLAAKRSPQRFSNLIMIGPSPCYVDQDEYVGGFTRAGVEELLTFLSQNQLGWSAAMAPAIMANGERPELANELEEGFCAMEPDIALRFARVTFLSDNRSDLARVDTPTLILQAREDIIASETVGRYCFENLPNSKFVLLNATGHCAHLSAPDETIGAIKSYISARGFNSK